MKNIKHIFFAALILIFVPRIASSQEAADPSTACPARMVAVEAQVQAALQQINQQNPLASQCDLTGQAAPSNQLFTEKQKHAPAAPPPFDTFEHVQQ